MIFVDNLSYRYRGLVGSFQLGPLSVEIPAGKLVFWAGHNGSGKSTFARLLCRELTPDSGSVQGLNGTCIYHHQSVVDNIFPDLSVDDHLRLLTRDSTTSRVLSDEMLSDVRILSHKYPDELSGGQLQLVAFATVMLEKHSLYIFDEVFNQLDTAHADQVMDCIRKIIVDSNDAHCVIITHDLELVREAADLVHVFTEGRITRTLDRASLSEDEEQLINLVMKPKGAIR